MEVPPGRARFAGEAFFPAALSAGLDRCAGGETRFRPPEREELPDAGWPGGPVNNSQL